MLYVPFTFLDVLRLPRERRNRRQRRSTVIVPQLERGRVPLLVSKRYVPTYLSEGAHVLGVQKGLTCAPNRTTTALHSRD